MAETLPRIAWIMIVKESDDEAEHLKRCLYNIKGYVDGIFINLNRKAGTKRSKAVRDVITEFNTLHQEINWIQSEWKNDFAEARNRNLAQVPSEYEWCIWGDTDDTLDKPEKLRKVVEHSEKYDSIYVDYLYDRDEEGNPLTVHMVARVFKNNGSHRWKGSIHETLVEQRSALQGMTKDFTVIHHADADRTERSWQRNIKMLEAQMQAEEKDPDPRTFYYLACTYMDAQANDAAKELFAAYLDLSGWDQERCVAETKLGRIFLSEGNRAEAKKHFMLAIGEDPDSPDPRVELGSLELEMEQYNKARGWLEGVEKMEKQSTTLERNPMTYTFRAYLLLAETYLGMGGKWLDKASEYAHKALSYKKKDKKIKEYVETLDKVVHDKHLTEKLLDVYKELRKNKEEEKMELLIKAAPKQLEDNPIIVRLRDKEPFKWPEKSIAIMTGDTALDAWGPWSLEQGIGGSEEAIIRIAPKLRDLGYKVVVFGKPGHLAAEYDGVVWRNYWECNLQDEFDIFIAWRAPFLFENEIRARKSYLWLHDVMEPGEFTEKRIANFDKCILLSKYHRSLFPMIPDEKVLMSGNGITPEEFLDHETNPNHKRDPHKMVYTSSHVRGLAYLYKIWPEIKAAVPDATLDVYYGRESYDKVHKGNPERMKWMDDMIMKAEALDGVTDHGKVGQIEINRAFFGAGIWPYPCPFPEIYCITAIKAQACGAVPVASNYAALDETIQFGHKQPLGEFNDEDLEKYKESLIWWLQHPEEQDKIRHEMMVWALTQSWDAIAIGWSESFNED